MSAIERRVSLLWAGSVHIGFLFITIDRNGPHARLLRIAPRSANVLKPDFAKLQIMKT